MSENPDATEAPSDAEGSGPPPETVDLTPRRNPMPWLLVTVLVVLAAVLVYAVVMVVRMLS